MLFGRGLLLFMYDATTGKIPKFIARKFSLCLLPTQSGRHVIIPCSGTPFFWNGYWYLSPGTECSKRIRGWIAYYHQWWTQWIKLSLIKILIDHKKWLFDWGLLFRLVGWLLTKVDSGYFMIIMYSVYKSAVPFLVVLKKTHMHVINLIFYPQYYN